MKNENEISERLARIEEQLRGICNRLEPLASIPVLVENAKTRIEALEESSRESKRFRWGWISAISAALVSSIGALIATWLR